MITGELALKFKKPVIVTTKQNICGQNIHHALLTNWDFKDTGEKFDNAPIFQFKNIRMVISEKDVIFSDHLDSLKADLIIFGSRHKSEANKPSLLTHITGNLGSDNSHGGNPFELAYGSTEAIKTAYLTLKQQKEKNELQDFDVTVEATHHGPTNLKSPLIYVEVGSTEIEYKNERALTSVANAIMEICKLEEDKNIIPSICFGGGHYATRFNELMEITPVAIGHILPKYHKDDITQEIVEQMITKTIEKVKWAIIDRSSLNATLIDKIKDGCSTYGVEVVKAKDVKYGKIS